MPEKEQISERDLIRNCKSGNLRYQEKLYKLFYGYAMGIGLRYSASRDDAMEIVNDSFIKLFHKLEDYQEDLPFKPWLRKIIVNTSIDRRRKDLKHSETFDLEEARYISHELTVFEKMKADDLLEMIRKLPDNQSIIFNLYEIDGYSHEEIGKMLGIPSSSSRVYLSRAKERLRRELLIIEKEGYHG